MEASALTHASSAGLLGRRSPLLRLQRDDRLIALIREGHDRAFEVLFDRYEGRLLGFCRQMLGSHQDAEDVLQDVMISAHAAMLADRRPINVRPWLYRIARNRCLNHLRRPVADGQDTMDVHPSDNGTSTAERVQRREELRALFVDVGELPETQRTALLLRETEALSYEEIAETLGTTIPAVKSLLVRARMALAEASESRVLTCEEVRLELAEAAEGLKRASGPVRHHVRHCEGCTRYRSQLRSSTRALASLAPIGLLAGLRHLFASKLGAGSAAGGSGTAGAGAGGAGAAGSGIAIGGALTAAGGTVTGLGGILGAKAAAGLASAALVAGAVSVQHYYAAPSQPSAPPVAQAAATNAVASIATKVERTEAVVASRSVKRVVAAPIPTEPTPADTTTTDPVPPVEPPADTTTDPPTDPAPAPADGTTDGTTDGGDQAIGDATSTDGSDGSGGADGSSTDDGDGSTTDDGTGGGPTYTDPPPDPATDPPPSDPVATDSAPLT
jgi:RNA polymerase sigma factor (sigma-70 family)